MTLEILETTDLLGLVVGGEYLALAADENLQTWCDDYWAWYLEDEP